MTEPHTQDLVNTSDVLRQDSQQKLLVYIDFSFFSCQLFKVIETREVKIIDCSRLPVHNVDKATKAIEDKWRVFMYAILSSCNDLLKVLIIVQVITSCASAIPSNNASAHM